MDAAHGLQSGKIGQGARRTTPDDFLGRSNVPNLIVIASDFS
jgi:hypothetical protein